MRIVAGEHRGRTIAAPDGLDTRPTSDRVRESVMSSLFSMLGGFESVRVLDAFSGSGAMGLEALSRGAAEAVLNDRSPQARACIEANASALHYGAPTVRITSVDVCMSGFPSVGAPFDLVFLDPPYATEQNDIACLLAEAQARGLFAPGCVVVYEHDAPATEVFADAGFVIANERRYGKTYVTYLTELGTSA